jgi:hypothetical protein
MNGGRGTSLVSVLMLCLMATFSGEAQRSQRVSLSAQAIERGYTIFQNVFTIINGLGPEFNAPSCTSCHNTPTTGGSGKHRSVELMRQRV